MLILASASPRRRELLTAAGIPHRVQPANIVEVRQNGEPASAYVLRLAREKAAAISADEKDVVLAADTVVCLDDRVLEKPRDEADARAMLRSLSGREHVVLTGICLRRGAETLVDSALTRVWFEPLSETEIAAYTRSREPMDKAGAYAIQGLASKFIQRVEGCYQNVVGLPISLVYRHLKAMNAIGTFARPL